MVTAQSICLCNKEVWIGLEADFEGCEPGRNIMDKVIKRGNVFFSPKYPLLAKLAAKLASKVDM